VLFLSKLESFRKQLLAGFSAMALVALAACSPSVPMEHAAMDRGAADAVAVETAVGAPMPSAKRAAKLGTQWGEGVQSAVVTENLRRISNKPLAVETLAYAAFKGRGEQLAEVPLLAGRIGLRVLKDNGRAWPIFKQGTEARLHGKSGERYVLEYRNYSTITTYEVVATVDGLDVLSGQKGRLRNNGYILHPGEVLRIKGFRKSSSEVAAFRFSSVADSYAANSVNGSTANVGVIGTAVFELNAPAPTSVCKRAPCAFPGESGYAPPPRYK
jgi:hypothetical protein